MYTKISGHRPDLKMSARKLRVLVWTIASALLIGQITALAQKAQLYEQPYYLLLTGRGEPKWEVIDRLWEAEKFYPIGWSKDGKFAYYTEPPKNEADGYFARLVIQDLRTNKILWEHMYPEEGELISEEDETIATFWKRNQALFSRQLTKHKIVSKSYFELKRSSIDYENDFLTPALFVKFRPGDDGYYEEDGESYYGKRGKAALVMFSERRGRKVIFEKSYPSKQNTLIMDLEVPGLLRSPFEPRAAVIVVEILRGHEDSRITKISVVGAHLTKGYKKNK